MFIRSIINFCIHSKSCNSVNLHQESLHPFCLCCHMFAHSTQRFVGNHPLKYFNSCKGQHQSISSRFLFRVSSDGALFPTILNLMCLFVKRYFRDLCRVSVPTGSTDKVAISHLIGWDYTA